MLIKVEIQNFMSHQKTVLEFIPGTNVIIGESDRGKSAIFAAINWVISNRPLGDSFRSVWGGDTKVVLHTAEGDIIQRIRSDSRNEYVVNGMTLEAFGTQVPEMVSDILQMDSYNIQAQMDPDFLLSHTPGEAARILNKAAAIDEIDTATSGISKALARLNSGIKAKELFLFAQEQNLKQYEDLDGIELEIVKAEKLDESIQNQKAGLVKLHRILSRIAEVESILDRTKHLPEIIHMVAKVEKRLDAFTQINKQRIELDKFISRYQKLHRSIKEKDAAITELENELKKFPLVICPICGGALGKEGKNESCQAKAQDVRKKQR